MKKLNYIIICPVRNEEKYIEVTIQSIIAQTLKPSQLIIVDDGSTDNTPKIIEKYLLKNEWISIVPREDRGFRKSGSGVVEAFYEGFDRINIKNWDYIAKIDGDLKIESNYFKNCILKFEKDPSIGIGGGDVYIKKDNEFVIDDRSRPMFHVRGATKIYRRQCWDDIGGIYTVTGWDTLDELKANMLGWRTETFEDQIIIQLRKTGESVGKWKDQVKNGLANYITGYHPLFMFLKIIKRSARQPLFVESTGLGVGYISGYLKRIERIKDKELINYIRKQQMNKILMRKSIWQY